MRKNTITERANVLFPSTKKMGMRQLFIMLKWIRVSAEERLLRHYLSIIVSSKRMHD